MQRKQLLMRADPQALADLASILPERLGKRYLIECFAPLYRRTLSELRGRFSVGELSLILDVLNGTYLTAQLAGQHLAANIADAITLDVLAAKWQIDATDLIARIRALTPFEAASLELWAVKFWDNEHQLESYIHPLL